MFKKSVLMFSIASLFIGSGNQIKSSPGNLTITAKKIDKEILQLFMKNDYSKLTIDEALPKKEKISIAIDKYKKDVDSWFTKTKNSLETIYETSNKIIEIRKEIDKCKKNIDFWLELNENSTDKKKVIKIKEKWNTLVSEFYPPFGTNKNIYYNNRGFFKNILCKCLITIITSYCPDHIRSRIKIKYEKEVKKGLISLEEVEEACKKIEESLPKTNKKDK